MRNAINTLQIITRHPLNRGREFAAIGRFVRWQVGSRILKAPIACRFGRNSRLLVSTGMTGATQNIYCGLHEFYDMAFVMHALRPGDLFVDVGANVGTYTVLAAEAGADCVTFEPVPSTFKQLSDNLVLNGLMGQVQAVNAAIGAEEGTIAFSVSHGPTNHVAIANETGEVAQVPVRRLDDCLERGPTLIKIDVEGYETLVLKGAAKTLADPDLLGVIMEVNGSGRRYGFTDEAIRETMTNAGFGEYRYSPMERRLSLLGSSKPVDNVLFVKSPEKLEERLASANPVTINGVTF